jgi:hypothetical protein
MNNTDLAPEATHSVTQSPSVTQSVIPPSVALTQSVIPPSVALTQSVIPKKKKETLAQQIMNSSRTKLTLEEEKNLYKKKLATELKSVQFRKVDLI